MRCSNLRWHLCCILWRIAVLVPLLHLLLHVLGIPHPEAITFIP
jgi:hypothetical protein